MDSVTRSSMVLNNTNWRNIAFSLTDPDFGEQTAQACANAWLQQFRRAGALPYSRNLDDLPSPASMTVSWNKNSKSGLTVKLLRRIVLTVIATLGVIYVITQWVAPIALSYYAVRKAPAVVRIVPTSLSDLSISDAPGIKLSYIEYEFEVPWTDLDERQTKLYPKDKTEKTRVDLHFKSGLRMLVTALPAREFVDDLPKEFNVSSQKLEIAFGREMMKSDYSFHKALYEFTPDKMHHYWFQGGLINRDEFLLILKSIVLSSSASSGIFNIQGQNFVGFQQGNPQAGPRGIMLSLYSDNGTVEMILAQQDYRKPLGIKQPEINRVIHSLRAVPQQKMELQARLGR